MKFSRETELCWSKSLRTDAAYVDGAIWGIRVDAPGEIPAAIAWTDELRRRIRHEFGYGFGRSSFQKIRLIIARTRDAVSFFVDVENLYADKLGPLVDRLNAIADEMMNLSSMEK